MNINCIICSDLFGPSTEIYTTTCGHIFHYTCLIQWLERSRTCPQCRNKATDKTIHRVYFNLANSDSITDDAATLQHKLDNLQFQMKLKDKDIEICSGKYKKYKEQNELLRTEIKTAQHKTTVVESAMFALQDQVKYFKDKSKENSKLYSEVMLLKSKLRDVENVSLITSGTKEQVVDMLRDNRNPESLALMVLTLKKELIAIVDKKKLMSLKYKQSESKLSKCRTELNELTKQNTLLQIKMKEYESYEVEKKRLKFKIKQLESEMAEKNSCILLDTSLKRIMTESPIPLPKKSELAKTEVAKYKSPSVNEKVQTILTSDSPYLPVKSSNVAISEIAKVNSNNKNSTLSIFKNKSSEDVMKKPETIVSYDGLGGHKEEHVFSVKHSSSQGTKRSASKSSTSSKKFKKLAPNKKIDDFINLVDCDE